MDKQKVSFQISKAILWKFNEEVRQLPLARDQLLNCLIRAEIPHIAEELAGKKLSDKARKFITQRLKDMDKGTQAVSVLVDSEVVARLNDLVAETNINRDSFINRLMYFFLMTDGLRSRLGIRSHVVDDNDVDGRTDAITFDEPPVSPLAWLKDVFSAPLVHLRNVLMEEYGSVYLIPLPERFVGLTCYAEYQDLPGTDEYKRLEEEFMNSI